MMKVPTILSAAVRLVIAFLVAGSLNCLAAKDLRGEYSMGESLEARVGIELEAFTRRPSRVPKS
jgi:hypothetical protein